MIGKLFKATRQANSKPSKRWIRLTLEAFEDRCLPATFTWFQTVDGSFTDPTKWRDQNNNPGVPGAGDDASIPTGAYTVTISTAITINTLTANASLNIASGGSLTTVNNNPVMGNSSTIVGLNLASGTTLQVSAGITKLVGSSLNGTIVVPTGATLDFLRGDNDLNPGVSLTGNGLYLITGDVFGGPRVHLNTDLTAPTNILLQNGILDGARTLTINGTFNWLSGGAGGATMGGTGVTNVLNGATLNISGTNGDTLDTRTLNIAGTLNWTGPSNFNFSGSALNIQTGGAFNIQNDQNLGAFGTINNAGTITKTSPVGTGVTGIGSTLNNTGTIHVQSGQLRFTGGGTNSATYDVSAGQAVEFAGGTYTFNSGTALNGTGQYLLSQATMNVNTNVSLANFNEADGNAALQGTGTVAVTGTLNWSAGNMAGTGITSIPANATLNISGGSGKVINTRTINNLGTVNWSGAGNIGFSNGGVLNNQAGATFNIQNDADFGAFGTFNNAGTLNKTSPVGTGITFFDSPLNNTGTISVQSGRLQVNRGGTSGSTFSIAAGSQVQFTSNVYNLNSGTTFIGTGSATVSGADVEVIGNVTAATFGVDSGTLGGAGTLTVTGSFDFTGGTLTGSTGALTLPAGSMLTIRGTNQKTINGRTVNVAGTATWMDAGNLALSSGAFNVVAGGSFTIQNDQTLSGNGTFTNSGITSKTGGPGATTVGSGVTFNNNGMLNLQSGTISLGGSYTQNTGTTALTAGTTLASGGSININGGSLVGTGTLNGNVANGGTLSPGGAGAGTLTIAGTHTYTQTSGGTLSINLGGQTAGSQFSQLIVGGAATLAGSLQVNLINSFLPDVGNAFPILSFSSATGSFATQNGLTIGTGRRLDAASSTTGLTLNTTPFNPGVLQFGSTTAMVSENAGAATITITRTSGTEGTVSVHYAATPGTAVQNVNFTPASGTVTFNGGDTSKTFIVPILDDGRFNAVNKTVNLALSSPTGGASLGNQATTTLTIAENDVPQPGQLQFLTSATTVFESAGNVTLTVTRTSGSDGPVSVTFATSDGTAVAGTKYTTTTGALSFAAGETSKSFNVPIISGSSVEGNETFKVTLSNATGGGSLGAANTVVVTIKDDDGTATQRYVANLYLDLLGRPVDSKGLTDGANFLNGGGNRTQYVRSLENSQEYASDVVKQIYRTYLHREADPQGLASFTNMLLGTTTVEQISALFIGSQEYFQNRGGGTNEGFVNALYLDVLMRAADPTGLANFKQALASGTSRTQLATIFFSSGEYAVDLVSSYYLRFLHRPGDSAGINSLAGSYLRGTRDEDIIAIFASSGEYFNLA